MDPASVTPYALALLDYARGGSSSTVALRRSDGLETPLPAAHFFRSPDEFSPIERAALERCRGRVLDAGAGTGVHSLWLQARGLAVTAIDICPELARLMKDRGVADARCADILDFSGGPFDTVLFLGHGIGMVEDLAGLERLLGHAHTFVGAGGAMLVHSLDVTVSDDPVHRAYQRTLEEAGRYPGEIRIRFQYGDLVGPLCGWLHVDPRTLARMGRSHGWSCEVVLQHETGEYLARLARQRR